MTTAVQLLLLIGHAPSPPRADPLLAGAKLLLACYICISIVHINVVSTGLLRTRAPRDHSRPLLGSNAVPGEASIAP